MIPQSVVLVMDRSGSMGETTGPSDEPMERMALVHRAVELLLAGLPGRTRVGVVGYDDRAATVVEPTQLSGNADWIMDQIYREVYPRGSTKRRGLVWCGASTWLCGRLTAAVPCW